MESLGHHLRTHREARGIPLEEIARVSKIGLSYLHAIEQDAYHLLPARAFTIGFLKQYALHVGLDPDDVVLRYRTAVDRRGERPGECGVERSPRRSLWIVAGGVSLLISLWAFLYPGSEGTEHRIRTIRIPRSSLREVKKEELKRALHLLDEPGEGRLADSMGIGSGEGLRRVFSLAAPVEVILQGIEKTWVRVRLDDEPEYERMLNPGEQHMCHANKRVHLRIGNGGGLRIFYHGKVYEHLGKKGEVVVISFPPAESDGPG